MPGRSKAIWPSPNREIHFDPGDCVDVGCAQADSLDAIFARMDKASKKFKGVTANLHQEDYMAVIDETTKEDGSCG